MAPVVAIEPGDAGFWQCEQCDNAYEIEIEFRQVSPKILERRQGDLLAIDPLDDASINESDEEETDRSEQLQRRLLDIEHEIARLNQQVDDLRRERNRLRDEFSRE